MSEASIPDPAAPLTRSSNLRRRQLVSRAAELAATAAAVVAVSALAIVVYTVVSRGAKAIDLDFVFTGYPTGVGPMLLGTLVIALVATVMAMPVGVLIALYLTEYAGARGSGALRLTLDLLNGLPSIILGLFVFALLVDHKQQSGFAGAVALAIIELPLIARGSQEVLLLVPKGLREASEALGVARWRSVLTVVLPTALGGIVTGVVLAIARIIGETAPLLITVGVVSSVNTNPFDGRMQNLAVFAFNSYKSPGVPPEPSLDRAWTAALVLIMIVMILNVGARFIYRRFGTEIR